MMANFALSGGGEVTWKGDLLTVRTRIIAIPVDKDLGSSGYFDIGPFEGLSIPAWHGVWYCPKKTQPNSYDSGALRVIAYSGSDVQPEEGWILIATHNGDTGTLKFLPGEIVIPRNGTYYTSTGLTDWATGPTGPTGAKGAQGAQGPQGAQGAQGGGGAKGATGAKGNPGGTGPQGPQGGTGAKGATGAKGNPGGTGPTGPQGPQGARGPQGIQGPAGAKGNTGSQGPAGGGATLDFFSDELGDMSGEIIGFRVSEKSGIMTIYGGVDGKETWSYDWQLLFERR
jgi:hypothetical protein